jgi:hypothetical protein
MMALKVQPGKGLKVTKIGDGELQVPRSWVLDKMPVVTLVWPSIHLPVSSRILFPC